MRPAQAIASHELHPKLPYLFDGSLLVPRYVRVRTVLQHGVAD